MLLVSFVIFCYHIWGEMRYGEYLIAMVAGVSALMVSGVTYEVFPENLLSKENRIKFLLLLIFAIALIIRPRLALFPSILTYVMICLVREVLTVLKNEYARSNSNAGHNDLADSEDIDYVDSDNKS